MNKTNDFDQLLAQNLRKAQPYIPDDGFSAVVTRQLAKQRQRERWFVGLPAMVITLLIVAQLPVASLTRQVWYWAANVDITSLIAMGAMGVFIALCGCAIWLAREMKLI